MKKAYILMLPMLLLCLSAHAEKSSKKKAKKAAPVEVVDTLSIDDFSFHYGRANTNGLKQYLVQRMGIDAKYMEDFMKGFEQKDMTPEQRQREKARIAGMEIREQVEEMVIPQASMTIDEDSDRLNREKFLEGFRVGVLEQEVPGIDMDSTIALVDKQVEYYHKTMMEAKYGENRRQGEEFLKKNAKDKEVKVTPSGLQYKVLTKGEGAIPTIEQKVKVHYRGTLLDETEFDSSYGRGEPAVFGVGQVINGWTEALTMMPVGSKWMLYIPYELAYGDRDMGTIKPFSVLVFEVELLEIVE